MTDQPNTPRNTARITEEAGRTFVQAERHIDEPVEGVLIVDLTASREATREDFVKDFTQGSEEFEELVGRVSQMGNIGLTLIVHNGDGVRNVGRFESPKELAAALSEIQCVSSRTQIAAAFDELPENADFVIVNGDTTDGDHESELVEKAEAAGIPVIPLLETTGGDSGTRQGHIDTLKAMGEASGVVGGPFEFNTRMSMLDFVAVSQAAVRGPEAVQALKDSGEIPQEVWDTLPDESLKSISEAAADADAVVAAPNASIVAHAGRDVVIIQGGAENTHIGGAPNTATPVQITPERTRNVGAWLAGGLAGLTLAAVAAHHVWGDHHGNTQITGPLDVNVLNFPQPADPSVAINAGMAENILFPTGSADVPADAIPVLRGIATQLNSLPAGQDYCVTVTGHASLSGNNNQALSDARAQGIAEILMYQFAIPAQNINATGHGTLTTQGGPQRFDQAVELDFDANGPC